MADTSTVTDGEQAEFMGCLSQAGLTPQLTRCVNARPRLAVVMVRALQRHLAFLTRVCGMGSDAREAARKTIKAGWKRDGMFGYAPDAEAGGRAAQ